MRNDILSNPILDKLPPHLHQYIKPQNYGHYTSIDQAVWRYVMRKNVNFLSKIAHESYLEGLRMTGVSIENIPDMYGMNRILKEIGWAAAAVDGFIPPAAFMEFQAYNVLVIASDIRQLEHIEYTPAPDIIHEAAGHAPIIANPEYAEYLRRLGEIGSKAISSGRDWEIYSAVRKLSQLKEVDIPDIKAIEKAQNKVDFLQAQEVKNSEMAKIRNLQWWSVEYGLIGDLDNYKIYGAGLLSSIGESDWCMSEKVKKLPYTLETSNVNFDITRPQPHLFVTPDFAHLSYVLDEFANNMALRKGGLKGIRQLIESMNVGTIELSTGIQISGRFARVMEFEDKAVYFQTSGPSALSYREKELIGHSIDHHSEGFGSPLGKLKGINLAIEDMSPRDLEAYNIYESRNVKLEFEGNVFVEGEVITGTRNLQGKIILISFRNCIVKHGNEVLFSPSDGLYHMAVGKEIVSAFGGPADASSFDLKDHELSPGLITSVKTDRQIALEKIYQEIRDIREGKKDEKYFEDIYEKTRKDFNKEWLLNLELYEWSTLNENDDIESALLENLQKIKVEKPKLETLINSGLDLIRHKLTAKV